MSIRGGSGVIYNNRQTGFNYHSSDGIIKLVEEDAGYPALYQIGRGKDQLIDPAYVWGNDASMPIRSGSANVVVDRDYFLTTKPNYTSYTYPHPLIAATSKKGDFNLDDKVNNLDFTSFKSVFKGIFNALFDLNSDSAIDVKDLGVLMSGWLE